MLNLCLSYGLIELMFVFSLFLEMQKRAAKLGIQYGALMKRQDQSPLFVAEYVITF